ncbi:MAG: hypothetical protein RXO36_05020 [Candidatus Nanopusillus acidilobi]|jgi:hypothetical protein
MDNAKTGIIAGLTAGGGALIGYLAGISGKTTVKFVIVTGHPKYSYNPELLVVQETKRAFWIQDPNTSQILKWLFNYTAPDITMSYQKFVSIYKVVEPGQLLWNKQAPSF